MIKPAAMLAAMVLIGSASPEPVCGQGPAGQRGCCSHHGGVCGCFNDGAKKCCDGTPSPSCRC